MATAQPEQSGTVDEALAHGRRLLKTDPRLAALQAREIIASGGPQPRAFRLLAAALRRTGDNAAAERADLDAIAASIHHPDLVRAAEALVANDIPVAERILRAHLKADPFDVAAVRMMAEVAARIGRFADAETLLRRAIELAPAFPAARSNLATILYRQNRPAEALELLDGLLKEQPESLAAKNLKAAALGRIGGFDEAVALYREILSRFPDQPKVWMSYGHVLKTVGRRDESIAAYRRAIAIAPGLGEVWWSLANLKTVSFTPDDIAAMQAALARDELDDENRFHLHFALGKALEDAGEVEASFRHYAEGNRLRRAKLGYDPDDITSHVRRSEALFTASFFAAREGQGCPAPDPIFIVGMPRAGSTLIEQILASHSLVEGTMELPDIPALVKRLVGEAVAYPGCLAEVDPAELRALGEDFLERTRIQRKTDKPFFIDKLPNNWAHLGFIRLILPRAKVIDARRHPLACCFSNFKQHFARGQGFSYDLVDLGRYYSDYVRMMDHIDAVLPGWVYRVFHERLIADPEAEVRRLLESLDLPFEEGCLRFHENERAVRTASSEQVRQPINRAGIDRWRSFEAWLDPLKQALGDRVTAYPEPA